MPQLSESISRAILRVSDAAALQFESFSPEQKGCSSATLSLALSLALALTLALALSLTLVLALTLALTFALTLTPSLTRRLWPLTREHLPAPLFDGYASRVAARLPWEYLLAS